MRVHVTQPLPEPSTGELLDGHDVTIGRRGATDAERLAIVGSIDALLSTPADRVDETFLASAPRLRIVANCAVGTDNVDLDACRRRDAEDAERFLEGHIRRTRVALTSHPELFDA